MLPMLGVATISLAIIALTNARSASLHTRVRVESQLRGVVGVLANSNFPLTNRVLRQMGELAGAELVLASSQGQVLATSDFEVSYTELPDNDPPEASVEEIELHGPVEVRNKYYYNAALRMPSRFARDRPVVLHVLFSKAEYDSAWQARFVPPLVVGVATLAVVGVVIHLVATRIRRVLHRLQGGMRLLAEGGFEPVPMPSVDDEIRDLTADVNQTAERLLEYEFEVRDTERLRTLNTLGAGLAHEMRNAATGCRMAIDLHDESTVNGAASDECLAVARGQLRLMEKRLDQFLKLSDGPSQEQRTDTDLCKVVGDVLQLLGPSAKHSGVRIDWRHEGAAHVLANPDELSQVVMNLALNALQAAQQQAASGKQAYVRAEVAEVTGTVELSLTDSGKGPSPAVVDNLFNPFTTDKPEGIGLGLAVARRVVESHGGTISWYREADETRFVVCLPAITGGQGNG